MKKDALLVCTAGFVLISTLARAQPPGALSSEQKALQESAREFVQAYDAGDAKAIAALWSDDGEYLVDQTTVRGSEAIKRLYEEFFRAHPGSRMEVRIDSIRVLAPTVAIEQGTASVSNSLNGPPSASAYTVVHVKRDGKWRMASVRESEPFASQVSGDLKDLDWLVGDWAARGDTAKVDVHYEWMPNKNFLRGETKVHPNDSADAVPGGAQIIGRDPMTGQIVSWFFNADGGHSYGVWTKDGARWLISTQGATADGALTTATNVLYRADDNTLSWQSFSRTIGEKPLPNTSEIVVERVLKDGRAKP